jgi:O-antigen/teichoic acid export membrane protein
LAKSDSGGEAAAFGGELRSKTRRSIGWMFGETVLEQAFSFLIFVLMARTLPKDELGTFAIVFVMMDMGREIARAGVFQRIAKERELTPAKLSTIFWLNAGLGLLVGAVMVALGHLGEGFFQAPLLGRVSEAMALAMLFSALGNTHMALRLREFGHRTMAVRSLIAAVLGTAVAVAGVVAGFGIWAFVAQRVVREVVLTVLAWNSVSWRPTFAFSKSEAIADLRFGREIVLAQLVGYLSLRAQDLIVAKFLGPVRLGAYRVAWRSAELLGPQLVSIFSIVSMQTFSRLQDDIPALRDAYRVMMRHCSVVVVPAMIGYGASGPWLVPAIFGQQWQDSGRLAVILSLLVVPFIVTYFFQTAMVALGKAVVQRRIAMLDLVSAIAVGVAAAPHGLTAIAGCYVARAYCIVPIQIALLRRYGTIGFGDHARALAPALGSSLAMGSAVVLVLEWFAPTSLPAILAICVGGALVYGALLSVLLPSERQALLALIRRGKRAAPVPIQDIASGEID